MDVELEQYREQFEAVLADAERLAAGLSDAQLVWRPGANRWSVLECLDHVNVTVIKYLPRIEAMIAEAQERGLVGQGLFRHPPIGQWFIRMLEPPARRKLRVPGVFVPRWDQPPGSVLPEFRRLRGVLLEALRASDGLDLSAVRTASPAARFFYLTLGQCYGALAAHDRRHLWQAHRVRENPDFPPGPSAAAASATP